MNPTATVHTSPVMPILAHAIFKCSLGQVGDAEAVDVPRLVWLYPDDGSKPGSVDLTTDAWLKKPVRVSFLCPISMKLGR